MKVLVCGSRTWDNGIRMRQRFDRLPPDAEIIHGNAKGADKWADYTARATGRPYRRFPADWNTHGKRAGILRNIQMLDERPDLVLAFWDGKSRGTAHTIGEARKRGIPVEIIEP